MTQILKYLQEEKSKYSFKVSVELEKTYEGMADLGVLADVVFVSKARFHKLYNTMTSEFQASAFLTTL